MAKAEPGDDWPPELWGTPALNSGWGPAMSETTQAALQEITDYEFSF
ncbi:hypothetical protein JQ561_28850 [Bradyrhizobium diazoefficiens]|nr:hypothetical protein [Bradyrhizobium diazoefficiens]MBR0930637.1 hypothetical protein [Bradyrhizobium diazoefficiens]